MKKSSQNKLIITLCVVNIFAVGIWAVLYAYSLRIGTKLQKVNSDLLNEDAKGAYVTNIAGELRTSEENRELIDKTFIKFGDEADFLENIENLATTTKVEIKVFSFEQKDKTLHLLMQTRGTFSRNYLFLSLLESLPYEIVVNKISMEKLKEEANLNRWETHYDVSVLSYIEK